MVNEDCKTVPLRYTSTPTHQNESLVTQTRVNTQIPLINYKYNPYDQLLHEITPKAYKEIVREPSAKHNPKHFKTPAGNTSGNPSVTMNQLPPAIRGGRILNSSQVQAPSGSNGQTKLRTTPLDTDKFVPYDAIEIPIGSEQGIGMELGSVDIHKTVDKEKFEEGQVEAPEHSISKPTISESGCKEGQEIEKRYHEFLKQNGLSHEEVMLFKGDLHLKELESKNDVVPCPTQTMSKSWKEVVADKRYPKLRLTYHAPSITDDRIIVSPPLEVAECGYAKWENSVVGCFLGRILPYTLVCNIAHRIWDKFGLQQIVGHNNGNYFFMFENAVMRDEVIGNGAWQIVGNPIIIQKWAPNFSFDKASTSKIPVWVKFHNIPVQLWT